jgi:hypothetical protein
MACADPLARPPPAHFFHAGVTRIADLHATNSGGGLDMVAASSRRDWIILTVVLAVVGVGLIIVLVFRIF